MMSAPDHRTIEVFSLQNMITNCSVLALLRAIANGCIVELSQLLILAAFHFASWLILYILCIFIHFIY